MWPSGGDMSSAIEIGVKEGNVYHLTGNPIQAQVHTGMNPCELWHRMFSLIMVVNLIHIISKISVEKHGSRGS